MKISTKIIGAFGGMFLILAGAGYVGYRSTQTMAAAVDYLSGPAWSTADGAMEGTIEMRTQQVHLQQYLAGDRTVDAQDLVQDRERAMEAFARMTASGLVDPSKVDQFENQWQVYQQKMDDVVKAKSEFELAAEEFNTHTAYFVELGEALESVGDSAVESLEQNPENQTSWAGGLSEMWAAADGGMESSIGHLTQLYHLRRLVGGEDEATALKAIEAASKFHKSAMDEMLATGRFDINDSSGRFGSKTLSQSYRDAYAKHETLMSGYIAAYERLDAQLEQFNTLSDSVSELVADIEEIGDSTVEGMSDELASTESFSKLSLAQPLGSACCLSVLRAT